MLYLRGTSLCRVLPHQPTRMQTRLLPWSLAPDDRTLVEDHSPTVPMHPCSATRRCSIDSHSTQHELCKMHSQYG